jgi:hypothetical protein
MKIGCTTLLMVLLFPLFLFAAEDLKQNTQEKPEELAVASAEQWLKIIDTDNYDKGWVYASEYLKNAVTKDFFKQSLQGVRSPLGSMKTRVLDSAQYTTSLPGSPDGEYVVMQFKTGFENKEYAVETLISKKEKDGQWKVAGYYIK